MSLKLVYAAVAAVTLFSSTAAFAYDRHFDFGQVWGEAQREHQRDEALSATPREALRQHPTSVYRPGSHDPSGRIILEGAN